MSLPPPPRGRNGGRFGTQTIRAQNSKQPLSLLCNCHGNWGESKLGGALVIKKKEEGGVGIAVCSFKQSAQLGLREGQHPARQRTLQPQGWGLGAGGRSGCVSK